MASGTSAQWDPAVYADIAGRGSAIAFMLSDQMRVIRKMQMRFSGTDVKALNLMHNASAQHALPSLLAGEIF